MGLGQEAQPPFVVEALGLGRVEGMDGVPALGRCGQGRLLAVAELQLENAEPVQLAAALVAARLLDPIVHGDFTRPRHERDVPECGARGQVQWRKRPVDARDPDAVAAGGDRVVGRGAAPVDTVVMTAKIDRWFEHQRRGRRPLEQPVGDPGGVLVVREHDSLLQRHPRLLEPPNRPAVVEAELDQGLGEQELSVARLEAAERDDRAVGEVQRFAEMAQHGGAAGGGGEGCAEQAVVAPGEDTADSAAGVAAEPVAEEPFPAEQRLGQVAASPADAHRPGDWIRGRLAGGPSVSAAGGAHSRSAGARTTAACPGR